jgi:hypothetical protein
VKKIALVLALVALLALTLAPAAAFAHKKHHGGKKFTANPTISQTTPATATGNATGGDDAANATQLVNQPNAQIGQQANGNCTRGSTCTAGGAAGGVTNNNNPNADLDADVDA